MSRAFLTFRFLGCLLGGSRHHFGAILDASGIPWGLFGRLGSSLATLGGHFGLSLLDLGVPWAQSGCIGAAFFVTLGSNMGPKNHSCMMLGAAG